MVRKPLLSGLVGLMLLALSLPAFAEGPSTAAQQAGVGSGGMAPVVQRTVLLVRGNRQGATQTTVDPATNRLPAQNSTVGTGQAMPQTGSPASPAPTNPDAAAMSLFGGGVCVISAEGDTIRNNPSWHSMIYFGNVYCGRAFGVFEVWLEESHIGSEQWSEIPNTHKRARCWGFSSTCSISPTNFTFPYEPFGRKVRVAAQWQDVPHWSNNPTVINNSGVPYPYYRAPWGELEFPDYGKWWPVARWGDFRGKCEARYRNFGYAFPPVPYDAHHVKPRSVGGESEAWNCVLLPKYPTHMMFSNWWLGFTAPSGLIGVDDDN